MNKETILAALSELPAQVTLDEVVDRLIFIEKVEEGLAQLDRDEFKTQEEVEQLVKSWRK